MESRGKLLVTMMHCIHRNGQLFEAWEGFTEEEDIETGQWVAQGGAMAQMYKTFLREMESNSWWLKCRVQGWHVEGRTGFWDQGQII